MAKLCVNVDHVATVRQARRIDYPDPLEAALLAEAAGCAGITVHLREDRRHIQDADVTRLKKRIATKLNLEMAVSDEIVKIALKILPRQATIVPERRMEVTTEGGLKLSGRLGKLESAVEKLRAKKVLVSLFIDPVEEYVQASSRLGADAVEFNTGRYCEAKNSREAKAELKKIAKMIELAGSLGLTAHAGHGLNLGNVGPVAAIGGVEELNIGHSIVARAVMVGFQTAVLEMMEAMDRAQNI